MKKKFISAIAILMVLMFYGCGNDKSSKADEQLQADTSSVSESAMSDISINQENIQITDSDTNDDISNDVEMVSNDANQDKTVIKLKDDGVSGEPVDEDGIKKDPIITNKSLNEKYSIGDFEVTVVSAQLAVLSASDQEVADYLKIEKDKDYVLFGIGITVENTSDNDESIYPNISTIVTNTKEQVESIVTVSDDVGGTYYGNVVKEGQIIFLCPKSNVNEINHIKWIIDSPTSNGQKIEENLVIEFEMIK